MSFATETHERTKPILPLAAMVDILFLLLVFFITASTFSEQEPAIQVDLTPADSGEATTNTGGPATVITFTADNQVYIGDRAFTLPEIEQYLTNLAQASPDEPIYIRGDQSGAWGVGVRVFDYAREAGFPIVQIVTVDPEESE